MGTEATVRNTGFFRGESSLGVRLPSAQTLITGHQAPRTGYALPSLDRLLLTTIRPSASPLSSFQYMDMLRCVQEGVEMI